MLPLQILDKSAGLRWGEVNMENAVPTLNRLDGTALRRVFGQLVTGVTVVTSLAGEQPIGMTVNSFTPVSLDPPLVAFFAQTTSGTARELLKYGAFAVNILGADQQE